MSYKLFFNCFDDQFQNAIKIDSKLFQPITFKAKTFQKYLELFFKYHVDSLSTRSKLVQELQILHHTARAMFKYNDEVLNLSYHQFRSHFYFPNIVYFLIRFLPNIREFFQKNIKTTYYYIRKKNPKLIFIFENAVYTDPDVIKTDILYSFLGNAVRKINPLDVKNINSFYKQVFLNYFLYYFREEQNSKVVDVWGADFNAMETKCAPTRDSVYREVLINLQVEKYRDISLTMRQLHYNFNIFKNVIMNNEFQTIFLTSQYTESKDFYNVENSQYKILSFYNQMLEDKDFLGELKRLPLIYRLLKSVHLVTKNTQNRVTTIRPEIIKSAIVEELSLPFKNMLRSDSTVVVILQKIAENFVDSILDGEYISLQTLAPIKIDQLSFVLQLRKFIKLCLNTTQIKVQSYPRDLGNLLYGPSAIAI